MTAKLQPKSSISDNNCAEILCIGSELLLGNIVNTNVRWIAEELSSLGINHFRQSSVGDNKDRISSIVREISSRSKLLITTGGLGPTPDDLTTEAIASAFDCKLYERENLWEKILNKISTTNNTNYSGLKKQCFFPVDAQIINNPSGTAPGMIWTPINDFTIMTFPGVPTELFSMWKESGKEYIKQNFSAGLTFRSCTLKFSGISESRIAEKIEDILCLKNPTVAPYADLGTVKLRITSNASNHNDAQALIDPVKKTLKSKFPRYFFGEGEATLASVIYKELLKRKETIVFAESCTGGLLSSEITSISGSSRIFKGGIIAYSNELKESLLNISPSIINKYGAVSKEVAKAMAINIKQNLKSDWSIAISGIAGPEGGNDLKPVGLVHISIAGPDNYILNLKKLFNPRLDRIAIQKLSVNECLNRLRLILLFKDTKLF